MPLLASLALVLALASPSSAQSDILCRDGHATVIGTIRLGDFRSLVQCLDIFVKRGNPLHSRKDGWIPIGWVFFKSEGGDVAEAVKSGRFLRQGLAEVFVDEKCYSACFLAVVGAVAIYAGEVFGGKIGIHRIYNAPETTRKFSMIDYERYYNDLRDGARQYLIELDVPTVLIEKIFSVPSTDMYILTDRDLSLLDSHPAYEEWIAAQCPGNLSPMYNSDECVYNARWEQFVRTVEHHLSHR